MEISEKSRNQQKSVRNQTEIPKSRDFQEISVISKSRTQKRVVSDPSSTTYWLLFVDGYLIFMTIDYSGSCNSSADETSSSSGSVIRSVSVESSDTECTADIAKDKLVQLWLVCLTGAAYDHDANVPAILVLLVLFYSAHTSKIMNTLLT